MFLKRLILILFIAALAAGGIFLARHYRGTSQRASGPWKTDLPVLSAVDRAKLPEDFPPYLILGTNPSIISVKVTKTQELVQFRAQTPLKDLMAQYSAYLPHTGWQLVQNPSTPTVLNFYKAQAKLTLQFVESSYSTADKPDTIVTITR